MFQSPFVIGLYVGIAIALLVQIVNWIKCWGLKHQIKILRQENTALMSSATSIASSTADEIKKLKEQVANQKVTIELLREKPNRKELRELRLYATAYEMMVERAPGFAQAWQNCVREVRQNEENESLGNRIFTRPVQRLCQKLLPKKATGEFLANTVSSISHQEESTQDRKFR